MTELTDAIERIASINTPQIPIDVDLWDSKTVASYLKVTPRQVTERYAPMPDFPLPIRLPSTRGRGRPRWKAIEVIGWCGKYQETSPNCTTIAPSA